uniref:Major facilitator superfamily (MFS) profile domain-containing protein n=1 Tax=Populus trichocarpa TaxID=3694 RepID=A0A2K1XV75_POPTR|eukprot:XP_002320384.2 sugar transporter ERD6-like 7 [Populus trichocarpa]
MENDHDGALEDAREPLMPNNSSCEEGSGSQCSSNNTGTAWMVYLSTFVAVAGSFEVGSCSGYSSPTQNAIREDLSLSIAEYSLFGSILTVGAMIGAITSGPIADYIGRKGAMRFFSTSCAAGWLAIYFAKGALALDIGRLATGYGMGALSFVVPVFIAEIAPKNLRGTLTAVTQLMVATGVSVAFIIGTVLRWRVLALTGLIPCVILHVGLFLIPESPRWLAKRGREKEFETTLQKLRGRAADISYEAIEIKDYIETLERLPKAKLLDLFQRRNLHSVLIGVGLMVLQQFGGINAVCFYVSSIFEVAGFSPSVGTIIYAILQVVVVALNTTIIDKVGRKPLLLVSASGLVIACLITGLSFYLKVHELALKSAPMLAVTGILLYIGTFSAGMGPIPWVIMSEIFPLNIKGVSGSLATLVNWFCAWAVSFTFNFLMSWSSYGTFILYAAINAMTIAFVALLVPETKGRTLEQIQAAIR